MTSCSLTRKTVDRFVYTTIKYVLNTYLRVWIDQRLIEEEQKDIYRWSRNGYGSTDSQRGIRWQGYRRRSNDLNGLDFSTSSQHRRSRINPNFGYSLTTKFIFSVTSSFVLSFLFNTRCSFCHSTERKHEWPLITLRQKKVGSLTRRWG